MKEDDIVRVLSETNFWGREIDTGISIPAYAEKIKKFSGSAIVSVIGPRRSGKTTICMQILESFIKEGMDRSQTLYVNFEDPAFVSMLSGPAGMEEIYRSYRLLVNPGKPAVVVLDEVQNVPMWEKWVRVASEKNRDMKIIVTGSSSTLLSSEMATVLTGRTITVTVLPLSFSDFLRFRGVKIKEPYEMLSKEGTLKSLFLEYMEYGGFPAVAKEKDNDIKKALLKEYFDGMIFRDVIWRHKIKDMDTIRGLAEICMSSISSPVSATKMRNVLVETLKRKISPNRVVAFGGHLESGFLLFFVPIFSRKVKERKLYARKVYSIDTGVSNAVTLKFSPDLGRVAENLVFLHLKRIMHDGEIFYWRDKSQREVDFVIKRGLKITGVIQVCWDMTNSKTEQREKNALLDCMEEFGLKEGIIITGDKESTERMGNSVITCVPIWKWMLNKWD